MPTTITLLVPVRQSEGGGGESETEGRRRENGKDGRTDGTELITPVACR